MLASREFQHPADRLVLHLGDCLAHPPDDSRRGLELPWNTMLGITDDEALASIAHFGHGIGLRSLKSDEQSDREPPECQNGYKSSFYVFSSRTIQINGFSPEAAGDLILDSYIRVVLVLTSIVQQHLYRSQQSITSKLFQSLTNIQIPLFIFYLRPPQLQKLPSTCCQRPSSLLPQSSSL